MNRIHFEQSPNSFEMDINPHNQEIHALKYSQSTMILQSILETLPKRIQI